MLSILLLSTDTIADMPIALFHLRVVFQVIPHLSKTILHEWT